MQGGFLEPIAPLSLPCGALRIVVVAVCWSYELGGTTCLIVGCVVLCLVFVSQT